MEIDVTSAAAAAAWMVVIATSKAAEQSGRIARAGTGGRAEDQVGEARELRLGKTEGSKEPGKENCRPWSPEESQRVATY